MRAFQQCAICDHYGGDVHVALIRVSERGSGDPTPFTYGPRCDDRQTCERRQHVLPLDGIAEVLDLDDGSRQ